MKYLYDIAIMRPIIILLVVIYHSFAMYAGVWAAPDGLQEVPLYLWICKFAQGFHIEGMAFIAGYVYAFQCLSLKKISSFGTFVLKKAKRLFIPSVVFGILYYFLYIFDVVSFDLIGFVIQILTGVGHLWYLPMLFWCFIGLWVIDHYQLSSWWLLLLLAIVSICPGLPIPFGFANVPHFLFYCYLGYWLYDHSDLIKSKISNRAIILTFWIIYIGLCSIDIIFVYPTKDVVYPLLTDKLYVYSIRGILKLGTACSGILALYSTINLFIYQHINTSKERLIHNASNLSFGVYLCHQFILIGLYYHTPLLEHVGSYWFPWIGLVFALVASVGITYLALKTKIGQFLMK